MAEIARAGILSVDKGQMEAAQALGMSRGKAMRRVVLPQAMRVIVPPTGNETMAMLKDTSLLIAIPVTTELFYQLKAIGSRTFMVLPDLVAATLYYLFACSVLMVGQSYLEKRFGRGFGAAPNAKDKAAKGLAIGSANDDDDAPKRSIWSTRSTSPILRQQRGAQGSRPSVDPGEVVRLLGPSPARARRRSSG